MGYEKENVGPRMAVTVDGDVLFFDENGAEIRDDEIGWNLLHMAYSSEPTYSSESVPWDCIIYLRKFLTISNENIMYCGLFDEIAQPPPCDDRLQDVEYLKRILKRYEE